MPRVWSASLSSCARARARFGYFTGRDKFAGESATNRIVAIDHIEIQVALRDERNQVKASSKI